MAGKYDIHQHSNQGFSNGTNINHGGNQYGYIENFHNHAPDSSFKSEVDKAREVMRWISPQDFTTKYGQLHENIVPGTGQWFLQSEEFKSWKSKDKKYLWVSGKPGAGKSFLSTIVIDELKRSQASQVAFLYLSYKQEPSEKDLLGNLASQLMAQQIESSEVPDHVKALWDWERKKTNPFEEAPEFSQLEQLLSALMNTDTFLVIDALDEFDPSQHHSLLYRLKRFQNAKLMITSRDKNAKGFEAIYFQANENDIKDYIEQAISLSRLSDFEDQDSTLREDIKREITKRADGIFLLPRLHMAALAACFTPSDVRKALKELPHDRISAYESTVERIKKQEKMREWAMTALGWILHAQEPLQVEELRHALLIGGSIDQPLESGDAIFNHGNLLSEEAILACCCGLVEIELNPEGLDTFRFIHYSVQEFFEAHKKRFFPDFHARISLASAKYVCLPRLAHSNRGPENAYTETLQDGVNDYVEEFREYQRLQENQKHEQLRRKQLWYRRREEILDESESTVSYINDRGVLQNLNIDLKFLLYPFINYVGRYLGHHFSSIDEECGRLIIEEQICRHLQSSNFYIDLVNYAGSVQSGLVHWKFQIAAHMGSSNLVAKFLENEYPHRSGRREWQRWLTIRTAIGRSLLAIAVDSNQPCVVKFVLGSGDLVDLTDSAGHSLLIRAARGGPKRNFSKEVIQVLDEIRAYLEMLEKTEGAKSWIIRASDRFAGKFNPSGLNVHHFREVNPIELGNHIRLLSASAKGNSAEVSEILGTRRVTLDKINTGASNTISRTRSLLVKSSVFLAIESLHLEVLRVFLDHGIDVNLQDFCDAWTPLHRAVSKESQPMVELLLNYNARMDLRDRWCQAVWDKVLQGEIIQSLIKASITQPSALGYASEALIGAIVRKKSDQVKTFLENGVNPSIKGQHWSMPGEYPLAPAIKLRDIEMTKLLLEYNADPNVIFEDDSKNRMTMLDLASKMAEPLWKQDRGDPTSISIFELLRTYGAKTAKELLAGQTADHGGTQRNKFLRLRNIVTQRNAT